MAEFDRTNRPGTRGTNDAPPGSRPADPETGVRPEARRGSGRLPWLVVGGIVAAAAVVATLQRDPGEVMDTTGSGPRTVQTAAGDVDARGDAAAPAPGAADVRTGVNARSPGEPLEPDARQRTGLDRIQGTEVARLDEFTRRGDVATPAATAEGLRLVADALQNYDVGATGRTSSRGLAENLRTQADLLESGRVSGGQEGTVLRNTMTQLANTFRGLEAQGDGDAAAAAQAFSQAASRIEANRAIAQQRDAVHRAFASASALFRAMGSEGQ